MTTLPNQLNMYGGQVLVHTSSRPLARVAVGNGDVLEVTTIEKRQLVLIAGAGKTGETTVHLWYEDGGQRSIQVNVNAKDTSATSAAVRQMLGPDSTAEVSDVAGNVVITGELRPEDTAQIEAIKGLFPNVVDLSTADLVAMQPMVLMDVRIMEVKRDGLRKLGIAWQNQIDGPSGGAIKDFSSSFYRVIPEGSPFEDIADSLPARINPMQTYFGIATTISSKINLLTQTGNAYELASPQLSARSGGVATFLAGGEIPLPLVGSFGQTSVEFKEYGIRLNIQPVVNRNNEISATIMTEISKIDPSVSVADIPGLLTRKTETEFNVKDGETIVLSGLVDIAGGKSFSGIPGLANIPILGRLFRSDDFQKGRTDLVVFVTPRVITPGHAANVDAIQKSDRLLEEFEETVGPEIFD
ncbi:type II and III secretion system protein family protein [Marilutibacter chinensis]|uniref:Pilus assembly protein N-terminal domain-containing protein n=1 Tax=Marilutibacter chinensis TaxID=2912247 RepID=A0ABS9HXY9_9GAMM|nr:pilus assembly protein N-terminal domain-containing protein [Lysobacter chinensis]MCF7223598.1 pilus assembly protein N-terminal domain-containing protein [Lysobacter chinensis]